MHPVGTFISSPPQSKIGLLAITDREKKKNIVRVEATVKRGVGKTKSGAVELYRIEGVGRKIVRTMP